MDAESPEGIAFALMKLILSNTEEELKTAAAIIDLYRACLEAVTSGEREPISKH